jgi:SNF2 family DNA or RNA helicase
VLTNKSESTGFAALVTKSAYAAAKKKASKPSGERWVPTAYMKRAVKFLVERGAAALLLDPGMRKTSISLAALKTLKTARMLRGALVVAPRRVAVSTWPREARDWIEFQSLSITVLHGDRKAERAQQRHDIYVINFEGLAWLVKSGELDRMLKAKWIDVLVIDELSKVKHHDSARHQFLAAHRHKFARCWGLTGSPASNGLLDLFGQAFILDMGKAFGNHFTHFRWNFFYPHDEKNDYPVWIPKDGAEELIYARMKDLALRIPAKGNLKMPEFIPNVIKLQLDEKSRKIYDQMEHEYFAVLDKVGLTGDDLVTAPTSAAANMKCRQIATGAIYEDKVDPLTGMPRTGNRKWSKIHDLKIEALAELRDELQGQQLMIVYDFGHDIQRIREYFAKDKKDKDFILPYIGGGVSDKKALLYEDEWNALRIQDIAVHPQSMAHGLNYQKGGAHHIAFFTIFYDYELYDQICRRLWRGGNPADRVFAHIFLVEDTVEEAEWASLRNKRRTQDSFQSALEEYRARRRSTTLPGISKL